MLLHGIFPPVTTPFYPEGNVYYKKLEFNVERYSRGPVAGLVVLGSTGEAILLSDEERRNVLRAAAGAASPQKVLIAGAGMESAVETLRLIEFAADLGYDAALVRTPYFYRNQMERPVNMLAFYRTVADRSPLPVMLYNYPQTTGYELPVELISELAGHPNIIGIKESSGSVEKIRAITEATRGVKRSASVTEVQEAVTGRMLKAASAPSPPPGAGDLIPVGALTSQSGGSDASVAKAPPKPSSSAVQVIGGLKTRQKEVGFQVVTGSAHNLLESLDAGAVGGILGFACAAPTACFETLVAWKERATSIAREKQDRIAAAALKVASELSVPGVKYAMDLNGYYGGTVRLPLLPLTAKEKADIERLIVTIRV